AAPACAHACTARDRQISAAESDGVSERENAKHKGKPARYPMNEIFVADWKQVRHAAEDKIAEKAADTDPCCVHLIVGGQGKSARKHANEERSDKPCEAVQPKRPADLGPVAQKSEPGAPGEPRHHHQHC